MKKAKRIFAWTGIIILLGMYLVTLVMAVLATPAAGTMFIACAAATVMLPILLYVIGFIYKVLFPPKEEPDIGDFPEQ